MNYCEIKFTNFFIRPSHYMPFALSATPPQNWDWTPARCFPANRGRGRGRTMPSFLTPPSFTQERSMAPAFPRPFEGVQLIAFCCRIPVRSSLRCKKPTIFVRKIATGKKFMIESQRINKQKRDEKTFS